MREKYCWLTSLGWLKQTSEQLRSVHRAVEKAHANATVGLWKNGSGCLNAHQILPRRTVMLSEPHAVAENSCWCTATGHCRRPGRLGERMKSLKKTRLGLRSRPSMKTKWTENSFIVFVFIFFYENMSGSWTARSENGSEINGNTKTGKYDRKIDENEW